MIRADTSSLGLCEKLAGLQSVPEDFGRSFSCELHPKWQGDKFGLQVDFKESQNICNSFKRS
jgi:hypothetical protein